MLSVNDDCSRLGDEIKGAGRRGMCGTCIILKVCLLLFFILLLNFYSKLRYGPEQKKHYLHSFLFFSFFLLQRFLHPFHNIKRVL